MDVYLCNISVSSYHLQLCLALFLTLCSSHFHHILWWLNHSTDNAVVFATVPVHAHILYICVREIAWSSTLVCCSTVMFELAGFACNLCCYLISMLRASSLQHDVHSCLFCSNTVNTWYMFQRQTCIADQLLCKVEELAQESRASAKTNCHKSNICKIRVSMNSLYNTSKKVMYQAAVNSKL